jgi:hypothetical protein
MYLHEKINYLYQNNKLAHFYIVSPSYLAKDEGYNNFLLSAWTTSLLKSFCQQELNLLNHPDLLFVADTDADSLKEGLSKQQYAVEEINELFEFNNYRPLSLNKKWIILSSAEKLNQNEIICNKLLKLLEEPQAYVSILLLNPKRVQLMQTIESRAIKLRIGHQELLNYCPEYKSDSNQQVKIDIAGEIQKIKSTPLHTFLEEYKTQEDWLEQILTQATIEYTQAEAVSNYSQLSQQRQASRKKHGQVVTRLYELYQAILLTRLNN